MPALGPFGARRKRREIYYRESRFGTGGLIAAERLAAIALGDQYQVESWVYEFFHRVGEGNGFLRREQLRRNSVLRHDSGSPNGLIRLPRRQARSNPAHIFASPGLFAKRQF